MLNLLIADDNVYYAKNLVNFIINKNSEIRLINISTDGEEAVRNIFSNSVDIIILDLKMPKLSGIEILDIIKGKFLRNNSPIIIVISGEDSLIAKIRNNSLVSCYISKTKSMNDIYNKICEVIEENKIGKRNLKEEILNELLSLGFNIKHKGTKYLIEAIDIVCKSGDLELMDNLEKHLYSVVACKHSKSIQNIKSNIMKSINCMYIECDKNKIKEYFKFLYDYKPTPKLVIATVVSKMNIYNYNTI